MYSLASNAFRLFSGFFSLIQQAMLNSQSSSFFIILLISKSIPKGFVVKLLQTFDFFFYSFFVGRKNRGTKTIAFYRECVVNQCVGVILRVNYIISKSALFSGRACATLIPKFGSTDARGKSRRHPLFNILESTGLIGFRRGNHLSRHHVCYRLPAKNLGGNFPV